MNNEIFYLESCLAIEKSIEAVRESVEYDDDFIFMMESQEGTFTKIKRKVIELIEKVKSIFTGSAMKKKDADAIAKAKNATGTIEVRDYQKLDKLYSSCKNDIKCGKDPEKIKVRWKDGLIILGLATGIAIERKRLKRRKSQLGKSSEVAKILKSCDTIMQYSSEDLKRDVDLINKDMMNHVKQSNKKSTVDEKNAKIKVQALSKLYSELSKSIIAIKQDIYTGTAKIYKDRAATE